MVQGKAKIGTKVDVGHVAGKHGCHACGASFSSHMELHTHKLKHI